MQLWRDRFLISVLIITTTVILGMFIFRMQWNKKMLSEVTSRRTLSLLAQTEVKSSSTLQSLPSPGPFRLIRVLDGDTIVLDNGETVRLIGVDAPEIHHPEIPVQRFGQEAAEFLRQFAQGLECTLEYEPADIRDQYGRLLAYVFVEGRLVNAEIIRQGYAYAYTRFPYGRQAEFILLERQARENQRGLWHLSLRDGRMTNLIERYESLNMEGRKKLDEIIEELMQKYPFE